MSTPETRPKHKERLPLDFVPGRYTVLCGRGKVCSASPGNRHLRSLVNAYLTSYSQAKNKIEKSTIVSAIVNAIRKEAPIGAFVKKDKNGHWWEVEDSFAREKIGCIFRDILHTQYRSSTKAKFARKKALEKNGSKKSASKRALSNTSSNRASQSCQDSASLGNSAMERGLPMDHMRNMPTSESRRSAFDGSQNIPAEQIDPLPLVRFPMNPLENQSNASLQPYSGSACQPQQNMYPAGAQKTPCMNFRSQTRFDVLRGFVTDPVRSDTRRSTYSLVNDAFQIMQMEDVDIEDFPDDLSDIFDEH